VRPGHAEPTISYSNAQADAFEARLRKAALAYPGQLDVGLDELCQAGRAYALGKFNYNLRSPEELQAVFTATGFEVVDLDTPEPLPASIDKPSVVEHGNSRRVRVLARTPL
jgi:hypothetical protein